jgi:hypothetical protein
MILVATNRPFEGREIIAGFILFFELWSWFGIEYTPIPVYQTKPNSPSLPHPTAIARCGRRTRSSTLLAPAPPSDLRFVVLLRVCWGEWPLGSPNRPTRAGFVARFHNGTRSSVQFHGEIELRRSARIGKGQERLDL